MFFGVLGGTHVPPVWSCIGVVLQEAESARNWLTETTRGKNIVFYVTFENQSLWKYHITFCIEFSVKNRSNFNE